MSSYQIIKLKNGKDLICNVLDNENGRLKVTITSQDGNSQSYI